MHDLNRETGWNAELELTFAADANRTNLAHRRHVGPLVVQRAFYPEGPVCHVYVIHPPGGVVGGDRLSVRIRAQSGSHALITTPAAGKFYRSDDRRAHQSQDIELESAVVEWLPQDNIFFGEAAVRVDTRVRLDAHSKFIGWEIACYGRPASGDLFSRGEIFQGFELWRDGIPVVLDHLRLDGAGEMMHARWGLNGHPVMGTLLACPATSTQLDSARMAVRDEFVSCTLVDGVLVCRAVSAHVAEVRRAFVAIWRTLRNELLDRPAVPPRIWAT